jgi:hypothetical protein
MRDAGLPSCEADQETAGAGSEARLALNEGTEGNAPARHQMRYGRANAAERDALRRLEMLYLQT